MTERIPMSAPDISEEDVQAVAEVVRSGRLALGPKTEAFEGLIADYIGVKHAVAVSSGTAALHLIVKALGIGPGDEVLVPSFTFVASANVVLYEGARPVFVDIEPETYNLDPKDLERKITPHTKAIMVVDVFGHPAEWDEILQIAEKYNLRVIDDSCEAIGAEYKGKKLGQFGDAAAFAFYPNKQPNRNAKRCGKP
ncbi:MAG: DegT/DnrJ/EryC1/StrS family aminotransferase [Candidatus Bipolaricaulaceae bacterium]